jgi:hypothetical protein
VSREYKILPVLGVEVEGSRSEIGRVEPFRVHNRPWNVTKSPELLAAEAEVVAVAAAAKGEDFETTLGEADEFGDEGGDHAGGGAGFDPGVVADHVSEMTKRKTKTMKTVAASRDRRKTGSGMTVICVWKHDP